MMDIFVQSKTFNPSLNGKAVRINGHDIDGDKWDKLFLVKEVTGETITLVNCQGEFMKDIHLESFEVEYGLKLTVLEEK